MGTAVVTLPDGKRARVTFDSPDQLDATVNDLVKTHQDPNPHIGQTVTDSHGLPHVRGVSDVVSEAVGEPALKFATGAASAVAGGVAGLARGAGAGVASLAQGEGLEKARQAFTEEAAGTIEKVSEAGTRQPRTTIGKKAAKIAEYPFTLLQQGADVAGQAVTDVTHSPAAGAAVNTAIQALPSAILPAARGIRGAIGKAGPAAEMTAEGAPRPPPSEIGAGDVPRGTPAEAPGQAQPPGATQGPAQPQPGAAPASAPPNPTEARAQEYARSIGLDWTRLGAGTRKALTTIAQDANALERLNPAAVKRQAHLQSLRVPVQATRGQLERDTVQLRKEAIASNTTEGQPIRDVDIAANRDLQANLEVLRGRVGGLRGGTHEPINEEGIPAETPSIREPTKRPTGVGQAVQEAARGKATLSKENYDRLYKVARETEPDAEARLSPITDLIKQSPAIQHLDWVNGWLSRTRKSRGLPEDQPLEKAKLNELDDLRTEASGIAGSNAGKESFYAGKLVRAIDKAMQDVPAGAKAWKEAINAFRKHKQEYSDQAIVRKLVEDRKGDRTLALEKTWKTIAPGPVAQLRQVKKTLLTGGSPETRMAGRRAWRDFRAETVNRILEDARDVNSADETEREILTEAALRRSIKRIPRENLEEILGNANVRELYDILRARRITTRSPVGGRTTQSGTVPNALVLFEKTLKHIESGGAALGAAAGVAGGPVGAGAGTLAGAALGRFAKGRIMSNIANKAKLSPLEQAARDVERTSRRRAARAAIETLERSGPTIPPGPPSQPLPIGEALKRPGPPP